jgi:signal transduction histidine kinase
MRGLARRRVARSRTSDWLIFLAGVATFTITVAGRLRRRRRPRPARAVAGGRRGPGARPRLPAARPLHLRATLASLGEARRILADPRPAIGIALLAAMLIGVLWVLLALPDPDAVSPSGVTLLLSIPFCLWISMQRRSFDGAAISFVAAHVALALLIADAGAIDHVEFVTGLLYLNALVAICQLVHAVNLDRLGALAEVEAQKAELERRVVERTARLHAMAEAALAADAAKTRFLATVSHEVRTPLAGVIGMAGVVLAEELEPRTRRYVEIIRTSGHHLLDVINRILDYARRDAPLREDDFVGFDLAELVDEVLVEAGFLPYAEGIALRAEIAPGLPLARRGYRHGLRQVLTNLVGNAAKFTEAGSVTVRLAALPGLAVRIEVEDTGHRHPAGAARPHLRALRAGRGQHCPPPRRHRPRPRHLRRRRRAPRRPHRPDERARPRHALLGRGPARPSAADSPAAEALAAVVRDRREAGQGGDAPPVEPAELRQLGEEGGGDDRSHPRRGLQAPVDPGQFGIGRDEGRDPGVGLRDAPVEHGDEAADVLARLGVGGLLEPHRLLSSHLHELAASRRLRLEGATRRRQRSVGAGWRRAPKPASMRASTRSVLAAAPIARAKSRAWRGLTRAKRTAAASSAARSGRS